MTDSVIKPKRPKDLRRWRPALWWECPAELAALGYPIEAWEHDTGLFALSALEVAETEIGAEPLGPEYHLSISMRGQRCTSAEAVYVLDQFDLSDATEDNHVPSGRVRNFWRPVADHFSGYECPCTDREPAIKEDGGDYVWRGITK